MRKWTSRILQMVLNVSHWGFSIQTRIFLHLFNIKRPKIFTTSMNFYLSENIRFKHLINVSKGVVSKIPNGYENLRGIMHEIHSIFNNILIWLLTVLKNFTVINSINTHTLTNQAMTHNSLMSPVLLHSGYGKSICAPFSWSGEAGHRAVALSSGNHNGSGNQWDRVKENIFVLNTNNHVLIISTGQVSHLSWPQ